MIFAFNSVSVLLIMIEMTRKSLGISTLDKYFKAYCVHEREKEDNGVITTHIELLMGCALAPTLSFIILDGGFFNSEFASFNFSGIMFNFGCL